MTLIDLDLYRDSHLIVESEAVKGRAGLVKWVITGEKQSVVDRASNALILASADSGGTGCFGFPGRITDGTDARCGWFRCIGYTSDNVHYDAVKIIKEFTRGKS